MPKRQMRQTLGSYATNAKPIKGGDGVRGGFGAGVVLVATQAGGRAGGADVAFGERGDRGAGGAEQFHPPAGVAAADFGFAGGWVYVQDAPGGVRGAVP